MLLIDNSTQFIKFLQAIVKTTSSDNALTETILIEPAAGGVLLSACNPTKAQVTVLVPDCTPNKDSYLVNGNLMLSRIKALDPKPSCTISAAKSKLVVKGTGNNKIDIPLSKYTTAQFKLEPYNTNVIFQSDSPDEVYSWFNKLANTSKSNIALVFNSKTLTAYSWTFDLTTAYKQVIANTIDVKSPLVLVINPDMLKGLPELKSADIQICYDNNSVLSFVTEVSKYQLKLLVDNNQVAIIDQALNTDAISCLEFPRMELLIALNQIKITEDTSSSSFSFNEDLLSIINDSNSLVNHAEISCYKQLGDWVTMNYEASKLYFIISSYFKDADIIAIEQFMPIANTYYIRIYNPNFKEAGIVLLSPII